MGAGDLPSSEEESRRRVAEIAAEISARATPRHLADEAIKTAAEETRELTVKALSHPVVIGVIGLVLGKVLDSAIESLFFSRRKKTLYVHVRD